MQIEHLSHYLLIIDPEPVSSALKEYFAQFNIDIIYQDHIQDFSTMSNLPTAILLHCSLLKENSTIIKQLYEAYPVPLLMINNHYDESLCISALEAGADDFIVKPIYPRELHARITAITRRVLITIQKENTFKEVLSFTQWKLYPASRQVFDLNHQELILSVGEYELLSVFAHNPQKILSREYLMQSTKNSTLHPFDRRIDVQISRLRQKIEREAKSPVLIKTIRNNGYMFMAQVTTTKESDTSA